MKVGYAQDIITPSLDKPVYLAGFGNNRRAETIHDDLYVRALATRSEDDKSTLVLVALDLIGFFRHDVYEVIATCSKSSEFLRGLGSLQVVIASVHPHHGPDTMGLVGTRRQNQRRGCGVHVHVEGKDRRDNPCFPFRTQASLFQNDFCPRPRFGKERAGS